MCPFFVVQYIYLHIRIDFDRSPPPTAIMAKKNPSTLKRSCKWFLQSFVADVE